MQATETTFRKEVLLDDERNRGIPAVVRYGPYLFVSGSDGHRDLATEKIDPELYNKGEQQSRNAYGRVARRLEQAGYGGGAAVWIQNFTSGQHWRLERMAMWPEAFGEKEHGQAVSFGSQCWMSGLNMLTASVLAMTPDIPREVGVPQPHRGRASRVTRCGKLVFVIGVRGRDNVYTAEEAPEEVPEAFAVQLRNCYDRMKSHLEHCSSTPDDFLRVDACIRDIGRYGEWQEATADWFGGSIPFAAYAVGTILGSRGEAEIGGIAVAPGERKEVAMFEHAPGMAQSARGGDLVFASGCNGAVDGGGQRIASLCGDWRGQVRRALDNAEAALNRFDIGLDHVLRLDAYVRDIYCEDALIAELRRVFGNQVPAITVVGGAPREGAEVEISVIAGAA